MRPKAVAMFVMALVSGALADAPSVVRMGRNVEIEERQVVDDAVSIGGDVTVKGAVRGDAVAIGGSVFLDESGFVDGSAVSVGGRIEGDTGGRVRGDIVEIGFPGAGALRGIPGGFMEGVFLGTRILAFIGFLALSLLLVALFPRGIQTVSQTVYQRAGKSFVWGVVGVLLIAPVAIVLAISIVGIVLIPLEIMLIIAAFILGYIAVAERIGARIVMALHHEEVPMIWRAAIGLFLLWLVGLVPFAGGLIKALASLFGFGAIIVSLIDYYRGRMKRAAAAPVSPPERGRTPGSGEQKPGE